MKKKEQRSWTSITYDLKNAALPAQQQTVSCLVPDTQPFADYKAEWYSMILHSNRIEDVEAWVSQFIKGTAIITDSEGTPYVLTHAEQFAHILASYHNQSDGVQKLSLAAPGVHVPGQMYLSSSIALPPAQWPDFFADLVMVCNLVISRQERAQEQLDHQREQWLRALLQGKPPRYIENEGYRLGLPIERGQVWVLAWSPEIVQTLKAPRKRLSVENSMLDLLKSPLLFLENNLAIILLEKQVPVSTTQVRNVLLKHGLIAPFWLVQGGQYHTFLDLKVALARTISLALKACREKYAEYVLDTSMFGLDSLLENPALAQELNTFANRLLAPLIEYDSLNGSHLTETLVLTRTLGSPQLVAEHLAVHVNTIRYRLHRAEDILGKDQMKPKDQIATTLAAFIWQHFHATEQTIWHHYVEGDEQ